MLLIFDSLPQQLIKNFLEPIQLRAEFFLPSTNDSGIYPVFISGNNSVNGMHMLKKLNDKNMFLFRCRQILRNMSNSRTR
jgi:hypothetical protein